MIVVDGFPNVDAQIEGFLGHSGYSDRNRSMQVINDDRFIIAFFLRGLKDGPAYDVLVD